MVFNRNHGFVMVFACGIPQRFDFKQHCGNVVNMMDTQLGDAVYTTHSGKKRGIL